MTVSLPSLSTVMSGSMPFQNGSFKLPPLNEGFGNDCRRASITIETHKLRPSYHSRSESASSARTLPSDSDSPILPSIDLLSLSSSPSTSSSASSSSRAPKIPHKTRPASPYAHHSASTHTRRQSIASKPTTPAFKLVPQPMLDPSKRQIRNTDALVVFPSTTGISQASQRKAKLLIGRDVERYFQLQSQDGGASAPRAYAYKVVWETRWSETLVKVMNKAEMAAGPGRRISMAMDME
ncbi:hypothetical protein FRB94_006792 [Tulasnella sp. JGI-2019a]|nr:hypothetical protein FRB93_010395 [Tulasnella sp. JGI-2019a]KAG9011992.1 hypothetical protein FRB94_006792 [Tulasnella sp. JGI-2019a]KAG9032674.1 hypothetical protein FRB95_001102 [Tulasnella sp. JGI-2019a]